MSLAKKIIFKNGIDVTSNFVGDLYEDNLVIANYKFTFDSFGKLCTLFNASNAFINYDNRHFNTYHVYGAYHYEDFYFKNGISSFLNKRIRKLMPKVKVIDESVRYFDNSDFEIICYECDRFNVTFIFKPFDGEGTTYIVFSGYGDNESIDNPYLYFHNRGNSKAFEKKIKAESFEFICKDIFEKAYDTLSNVPYLHFSDIDINVFYDLLRYKSYWKMTDKEKEIYDKVRK